MYYTRASLFLGIALAAALFATPTAALEFVGKVVGATDDLVFGKVATVREQTRDRCGRTVGRVYVDGRDVNAESVRAGYAWVYQKYATDRSLYGLEAEAKAVRRGTHATVNASNFQEEQHQGRARRQKRSET